MDPRLELLQTITRRQFLGQSSLALGAMAMASLAVGTSRATTRRSRAVRVKADAGKETPI